MKYLNNYLEFSKLYKSEIKNTKLFLLIIVNLWLFLIFWKILLVSDMNIVNNNVPLTKATLFLQPILSVLGIDVLSPNMLKMIVLTFIIMTANLSVLYFNQMMSIIILTVLARYSHKSYTNYLKNQENLSYLGFETKKETIQPVEPTRIVIENTPALTEPANHTHWGMWILLGGALLLCFGLLVYSHNNLNNNMIEVNNNIINTNNNLQDINLHTNQRIARNVQQINYNNEYINTMSGNLNKKVDLINEKITNLEDTVQVVGKNLTKVSELSNDNVLKLSHQSLTLSTQANEALTEIAAASNTVEATTIGLSKVVEILREYMSRTDVLETKMNSLTAVTPRSSVRFGNNMPTLRINNNE